MEVNTMILPFWAATQWIRKDVQGRLAYEGKCLLTGVLPKTGLA